MNYFKIFLTFICVLTSISLFSQINKDVIMKDSYFQEHNINLKKYMWNDVKLNNKINYLHTYRDNPYSYFGIGVGLDILGGALLYDAAKKNRYIISSVEEILGGLLIATSVPLHVLGVTSSIKQYKFKKALQEKFQY